MMKRRSILAIACGLAIGSAALGVAVHALAQPGFTTPSVFPTNPSLNPYLTPAPDPCTDPPVPAGIDCSAPLDTSGATAAPVPVIAPPPCTGTLTVQGVGDVNAQTGFQQMGVVITPLASAAGYAVTEDEAATAALTPYPNSAICAEFPAEYSNAGSADPTPIQAWVLSLMPAVKVLSHPPAGAPVQSATSVYVVINGQTGDLVLAAAAFPPLPTPTP
jgi:hypothetical protein